MRPASWRWGLVLAFALFAPVAMPSGRASDRRCLPVRRRLHGEPLLSVDRLRLRVAPAHHAASLTMTSALEPLSVLSRWEAPDGQLWLRVRSLSSRGWIAAQMVEVA